MSSEATCPITLTVAGDPRLARLVRMTAANVGALCSMSVDRIEDIRMAAEAAASACTDKKVAVVPTKTVPQAFSALFAVLPDSELEDAVAATKRLAGERPTILVTHDCTAADLLGWPVREV